MKLATIGSINIFLLFFFRVFYPFKVSTDYLLKVRNYKKFHFIESIDYKRFIFNFINIRLTCFI